MAIINISYVCKYVSHGMSPVSEYKMEQCHDQSSTISLLQVFAEFENISHSNTCT